MVAGLLLIAFVVVAERFGHETILSAFLAGALVRLVDRDSASQPHFGRRWRPLGTTSSYQCSSWRAGCDSICRAWLPSSLLRVPVFVLALLLIRGLPALLYVRDLGWPATVAVGLLPATSLLFLVTAATIGMQVSTPSPR